MLASPSPAQDSLHVRSLPAWVYRIAQSAVDGDPVPGLRSNDGIDIVSHRSDVWIGTSSGLAVTEDLGSTWYTYNTSNGLLANNLSALVSNGDTLWLATVMSQDVSGDRIQFGQGLQYSTDGGATWLTPADPDSVVAQSAKGPFRVTYDMAADSIGLFTANWIGGLIGTGDGGQSWKRFFLTVADSLWYLDQSTLPPYTSYFFSVAVDTGHTDTTILWAGTACGIARMDFVSPRIKASSNVVFDHAYSPNDTLVFFGGDRGLTSAKLIVVDTLVDTSFSGSTMVFDTVVDTLTVYHDWKSLYEYDGLPSSAISQVHFYADRLFVGFIDTTNGDGVDFREMPKDLGHIGVSISDGVIDSAYMLPGAAIDEIVNYTDRYLYVAGGTAGLFVSVDTGLTWAKVASDTSVAGSMDPLNGRNTVHSIAVDSVGDMWVGTDSGLVKLYMDRVDQSGAVVDSAEYYVVIDTPSPTPGVGGSAGSVRKVYIQDIIFRDPLEPTMIDSVNSYVWTANHPATDSGTPTVFLYDVQNDPATIVDTFSRGSRVDDIASVDDLVFLSGEDGLRAGNYASSFLVPVTSARDSLRNPDIALPIVQSHSILSYGDTTHLSAGFFLGVLSGNFPGASDARWNLAFANPFPLTPDTVALYGSDDNGLMGNFVPALGVQYRTGQPPIIWAACRPGTPDDLDVLCYDEVATQQICKFDLSRHPDSIQWQAVPDMTQEAWNFAFAGEEVYIASTEGLFHSTTPDGPFSQVMLTSTDPDISILPDASVNGVEIIGSDLWVATEDGFARQPLSTGPFEVYKAIDSSDNTFAYPVPFSPAQDGRLDFHYTVPQGAATYELDIFDFAMNKVVNLVNNNVPVDGGTIRHGLDSDRWDGFNGAGDKIAPGIYYFRIKFSNGDLKWGKLAVIHSR